MKKYNFSIADKAQNSYNEFFNEYHRPLLNKIDNIEINKKDISVNLKGNISTYAMNKALEELVNLALSSPSNYKEPSLMPKKIKVLK